MKRREKRQPAIEEQQLSINVPTAVVVLIKRIALKAIIAKHQWNSVIKDCMFQKTMKQKRVEDLERITSPYGIQLRVNRSIQAERSFASVKQDMEFRRYMYRGKENVTAQSVILAIAHNINKLHNKIQTEKTGQHLFKLKETA